MKRFLGLVVLLFLAGCGGGSSPIPPPPTSPVGGKVYLPNGSVMTAGQVVFKPREKGQQEAIGEIGPDGSYKLTSYNKDDGAMAGEYVVVVEKTSYKTGSPVAVRADVPKKYLSESSSDMIVAVKEGQADYPIRLK